MKKIIVLLALLTMNGQAFSSDLSVTKKTRLISDPNGPFGISIENFKDNYDSSINYPLKNPCNYYSIEELPENSPLINLANSVFKVIIKDKEMRDNSTGTMFCVSNDGLVLSNHHVLKSKANTYNYNLSVASVDGEERDEIELEVLLQSPDDDFILAKIKDSEDNFCEYNYLPISYDQPQQLKPLALIGNPGVTDFESVSLGKVLYEDTNKYFPAGEIRFISDLPAYFGSSGGPILNTNGVTGIVTSGKIEQYFPITLGTSMYQIEQGYGISRFLDGSAQAEMDRLYDVILDTHSTLEEKQAAINSYKEYKSYYRADDLVNLLIYSNETEEVKQLLHDAIVELDLLQN